MTDISILTTEQAEEIINNMQRTIDALYQALENADTLINIQHTILADLGMEFGSHLDASDEPKKPDLHTIH